MFLVHLNSAMPAAKISNLLPLGWLMVITIGILRAQLEAVRIFFFTLIMGSQRDHRE